MQKAGGKCVICGYKKNLSALAFHHLDEKLNSLSGTHLLEMSKKGAEEEMAKCVLVCHNCHFEIHNPDLTMKKVGKIYEFISAKKLTHRQAHNKFFDNK